MLRCIATPDRMSVRPYVCDVEVSWSHKLEYIENNFMADYPKLLLAADLNITDLLRGKPPKFWPE